MRFKIETSQTDEYGFLESPGAFVRGRLKTDPQSLEDFVNSDHWPKAVPDNLIVATEAAVKMRANSIANSFCGNLKGKTFLDFGCGDGSVVKAAIKAKTAWGFDPLFSTTKSAEEMWGGAENITTDFKKIRAAGPFDVILLYDVLDHIEESKIDAAMGRILNVSDANTKFYVRCHPWTSNHGGHCYQKLNKAYAHLFLNDEQLAKYQSEFTRKIVRPVKEYTTMFKDRFKVLKKDIHRNMSKEHEEFFANDELSKLIQNQCGGNADWQQSVLPIEFVDYVLTRQ